jgi:hypothetical protein
MAEIYHRTLGGRVTWVEMTRDEVEEAIARAPWEWAASPRSFAKWPADRIRGVPVIPASLADTAAPAQGSIWERT